MSNMEERAVLDSAFVWAQHAAVREDLDPWEQDLLTDVLAWRDALTWGEPWSATS